jgi:6-phosphogluconolactonase
MNPGVEVFPGSEELSAALAAHVAAAAAEARAARGRFLLAIPGGSVISFLARGGAGAAGDVAAWHVFWTDERGVPLTDPQSNYHLAQTEWLGRLAIPRGQLHPIDGALGPEAAARAAADELAALAGRADIPRFDLVVLGLGEDGHVASLFPENPALAETARLYAPVWNAPKPPPERVTLTLPVLNRARCILVAAAGSGKAGVIARIFAPPADATPLPAQRLRPGDGKLRWLLDRAAAARLPGSCLTPTPTAKEAP